MSRFESLPDRAMELVTQVGEGIKHSVPDRAIKWIETGAALSVLKTGTRVATKLVRRNPVMVAAAAAGAGLLWYVVHRKAKQAERGVIEGKSKRIEAKRGRLGRAQPAHKRARTGRGSAAAT